MLRDASPSRTRFAGIIRVLLGVHYYGLYPHTKPYGVSIQAYTHISLYSSQVSVNWLYTLPGRYTESIIKKSGPRPILLHTSVMVVGAELGGLHSFILYILLNKLAIVKLLYMYRVAQKTAHFLGYHIFAATKDIIMRFSLKCSEITAENNK